ncbi:MAG: aminoglycoside phosphotransferase, partial [Actinomycetota bacterium]|nr:aminoglycoside phosphotransferase [Actinomycetota bacterium]
IQWKAAGRGPRLADLAYLMWGTWLNADSVKAAVGAYRRHVELTDDELDRFEAVMYVRPLYLVCFDYRRSVANGDQPSGDEGWWDCIDPGYIRATAAATRAAFGQ